MKDNKVKNIVHVALFAALTYVATSIIKIPTGSNGYTHLGDGLVFLSVVILGKKNGSLAGALGASLADLLGGYSIYVLPTFIIKYIMGFILGTVLEKSPSNKTMTVVGAAIGSIWQVIAYYFVGSVIAGNFISEISGIPANILQSAAGIVLCTLLAQKLQKMIKIS